MFKTIMIALASILGLAFYGLALYSVYQLGFDPDLWRGFPSIGAGFALLLVWVFGGLGSLMLVAASIASGSRLYRVFVALLGFAGLGLALASVLHLSIVEKIIAVKVEIVPGPGGRPVLEERLDLGRLAEFLVMAGWPFALLLVPAAIMVLRE